MSKRGEERVLPGFTLTALNLATSAAYAACGDIHRLGDRYIVREYNAVDHIMLICENCGVPIAAEYHSGSLRVKAPKMYDESGVREHVDMPAA